MKDNNFIITRKIEIIPVNITEEKDNETLFYPIDKEAYKKLRDYRYYSWMIANKIMSNSYIILQDAFNHKKEKEKISETQKRLIQEKTKGECKTFSNYGYFLSQEFSEELPSSIRASLNRQVNKKFQADVKEVLKGQKTIANYRLKNMAIYFPTQGTKIFEENEKIYFRPSFKGKMTFALRFGRDLSNNRVIIKRIMKGDYSLSDSYLKFDKNKLFLYAVVKGQKEVTPQLDDKTYVGIDLGIAKPAVCAVNNSDRCKFIGDGTFIVHKRNQFYRDKNAKKRSINSMANGGKGYKRKMNPVDRIKDKESKFFTNINHNLSKQIVQFAKRNKASFIKMELLEGINGYQKSKLLKDWTYHQLQTLIKEKANREGIEVVFIDPYHTSQTCSKCGHYEVGQRPTQSSFVCRNPECENYGIKINADLNAAKNIAISDKIVTSKSQCEYAKKSKKKGEE